MTQKNKDAVNRLLHDSGCTVSIQEGYGMTEIGAGACANVPQRNIDGSVGIPLPLNNFCIYDNEAGRELSYNELGEICMTGPTVMKGYFNNPEETEHVLRCHADGLLWLHSGDLGYISEDGNVYLEGRLKRVIVLYNGFKIYPFGLEKTIMKHKNVAACCVVGRFDNEHQIGQVPVAFIVLKEHNDTTVSEIKEICKREQSEKYQLKDIVLLDSLPLTPNGKVDYRSLEVQVKQ